MTHVLLFVGMIKSKKWQDLISIREGGDYLSVQFKVFLLIKRQEISDLF